ALVGVAVLGIWLVPLVLHRPLPQETDPQTVQRYGTVALLGYCLMTLLTSAGEPAIAFTPGEVNLLFAGPFSRRQLLVYKIIANLFISVTTAVFMIIWLRHRAGSVWGGLVALVLIMNFIHLFSMATALITGAAGAEAYRHRRRLMLAGLIVLASLFVWHARRSGVSGGLLQWLSALEQIPVVHRLLTPLRWFIAAFT